MSSEDMTQEWEITGQIFVTVEADSEEEAIEQFSRRNEDAEITEIIKCNCLFCSKLSKEARS